MRLLPLAIAFSLTALCYGDTITLKNGRIINGTYLGGTPRQIKVEVGDNIQTLDVGDIARIEFGAGGGGGSESVREAPRDNGRPTLRRADSGDSGSSSSGGSSSGGYGSSGSGSRPVILQPDPNDTGSYPQSTASDNSRPTLRRAPSASSTDSGSSSSGNSGSAASSSSSSNDGDRPVLRRAAPDPASNPGTPAAPPATTAAPAAQPPAQPPAQTAAAAPAPPPTIKVGQTQDAVIAALGQPDSVSAEGNKQIYVYKSVKVTFVNGKVSKVE